MFFLVVFIDLERHKSFAYLRKKLGSKSSSSLLKIYLMGWVDFKVLEKTFLEGMRDSRYRRIKWSEVGWFYLQENKSRYRLKLIKSLIKKIKGKDHLG